MQQELDDLVAATIKSISIVLDLFGQMHSQLFEQKKAVEKPLETASTP